ncbi:MAG: hypothetical protein ACYC0V_03610 [Armatimonadota bacterium]
MIIKFILALILIQLICAGCCLGVPSAVVELFPEYEARINWSVGVVKAVGRAAVPGDIEDPDQARGIARDQAIIAARRNLLSALSLLHVTDSLTVNERMISSESAWPGTEALARNAGVISSRQIYDRSYEVIVQVGIYGSSGLASALFGTPFDEMPALIIDVQSDEFVPSMIPVILDSHQQTISLEMSNDKDVIQPAMRVYYGNARFDTEEGKHPVLRVKALKLTTMGEIILGKRDAAKLRALLKKHGR